MAATIKTKIRTTTGGTASTTAGELCVNTYDKKIFIGDGAATVELANQIGYNTITTLGTITTGTWSATSIGETKGGTGQTTYAVGDLIYSSATDTLSKLTKPAATTSFLQMTSAGVPSWQTTIPATAGGTGSTAAFTSGALVYASSTSVLTTGTVFGITSSANFNSINIATGASPKNDQYFKVSETLVGSSALFGLDTDASGGTPASFSNAYLKLNSTGIASTIYMVNATTGNDVTISAGDTGTAFSITSGLWEISGFSVEVLKAVDQIHGDPPYIMFGTETPYDPLYIKMDIADSACTMTIVAPYLLINTTTPAVGKVLTCMDGSGTVSWETPSGGSGSGTPDYVLFNLGII